MMFDASNAGGVEILKRFLKCSNTQTSSAKQKAPAERTVASFLNVFILYLCVALQNNS